MESGEVWPSYALRVYKEFAALEGITELSPLSPEASAALNSLQELGSTINKRVSIHACLCTREQATINFLSRLRS